VGGELNAQTQDRAALTVGHHEQQARAQG